MIVESFVRWGNSWVDRWLHQRKEFLPPVTSPKNPQKPKNTPKNEAHRRGLHETNHVCSPNSSWRFINFKFISETFCKCCVYRGSIIAFIGMHARTGIFRLGCSFNYSVENILLSRMFCQRRGVSSTRWGGSHSSIYPTASQITLADWLELIFATKLTVRNNDPEYHYPHQTTRESSL